MNKLSPLTLYVASKPGIRPWGYPLEELRKFILERDTYMCIGCSSKYDLEIHHIIPLEMGGDSLPENLITLCESCHKKEHSSFHLLGYSTLTFIEENLRQIENYSREMEFYEKQNGILDNK